MDSLLRIPLRQTAHGAASVLAGAGLWAAVTAIPADAQSSMPAGSPGRFTMHPADGGVLRMDTQTGALSMCKQASGSWACTMLPDDRTAINSEVERLKSENTELKASVKRLEELAGVPGDGKQPTAKLPTEEDVDKAMSYVQRMLKKFKEKLKELEDTDPPRRTRL